MARPLRKASVPGPRSLLRAPRRSAESRLLRGVVFLLLVAGACLMISASPPVQGPSRAFQHLVHGLGLGPALDLRDCSFALDPRLGASCRWTGGPFPAGQRLCPHHAAAVLSPDVPRARHG